MAIYHDDIQRVSEEIQQYLLQHPNAADTLEGIAQWWLARQRYEEAIHVVKRALDHLMARGVVVQSSNADDQLIYRKRKDNARPRWPF